MQALEFELSPGPCCNDFYLLFRMGPVQFYTTECDVLEVNMSQLECTEIPEKVGLLRLTGHEG